VKCERSLQHRTESSYLLQQKFGTYIIGGEMGDFSYSTTLTIPYRQGQYSYIPG
jgi:hypothetical protein